MVRTHPQNWRQLLERNATFDPNSRAVLALVRRRDAGLTRQMTAAEIAAKYASGAYGTPKEG